MQYLCTSQDSAAPFRWASRQTQADSKTGWQGYDPSCMAIFLWVVPPFFDSDSTAPVSSFRDLRWPFRSLCGGASCPHSRFAVASQACLRPLAVHLLAAHRVRVCPRTGLLAPALSWQCLRQWLGDVLTFSALLWCFLRTPCLVMCHGLCPRFCSGGSLSPTSKLNADSTLGQGRCSGCNWQCSHFCGSASGLHPPLCGSDSTSTRHCRRPPLDTPRRCAFTISFTRNFLLNN